LAVLLALRIVFRDGVVGEAAYLAATIAGAVLAWTGAGRESARSRVTWRLVAVGLALSALGDVTYSVYLVVAGEVPGASLADVGWLGVYLFLGVGVYRMAGTSRERVASDIDAMLDAAAVGVVALVVVWYASIGAILADTSTPAVVRVVWASYPILDAILLALAVRLLLGRGVARGSGLLFIAGLGCWLFSDFTYVLWAASDTYSVLLDIGWMVGPVLIGATAWWPAHHVTESARAETGVVGPTRLTLLTVPILVPSLIEVWGHAQGFDPDPMSLLVVTAALASLVYVRAWRLLTANARARSALRSSRRYFEALAANSSDASLVVDRDGRLRSDWLIPEVLHGGEQAVPGGTKGADVTTLVGWASAEAFRGLLARAGTTPGIATSQELRYIDAHGRSRWMLTRATDLTADPDVGGVVLNLHDITERKAVEEALEHRALHDALTGLPNRVLLRDRIEQALRRAGRRGGHIAVVYLDLDSFKRINDSLGHDAGDELLLCVADRLTSAVRPADTVARLGGDEFAILIEEAGEDDVAVQVTERVVEALDAPIRIGDRQVVTSASLGLAISDPDATAMSMLRDADVAMYRAKAIGGNQWVRHEPEMRTFIEEQLQLEIDLVAALDDDQFEILYQPVMKLDTNTLVGFEALLRWHHPTLGLIAPDRFIPIAERTGLIVPIGQWVLEKACATLAGWHEQPRLTMAVNVSGRQLASDQFVDHVAVALERSGVEPDHLVLEMTETVLIENVAQASARLHELRDLGVRLAIDDFGTGYSSLGYLRQFPVDILKIDRSFVNTIVEPGETPPIVRGLLDLASTLRLETVAEGIELDVQHEQLREGRCEMGQGYLFARPMHIDEADEVVAALSPAPEDARRSPAR
jgi:diguanylate cyclase (GGDEF)-like protein